MSSTAFDERLPIDSVFSINPNNNSIFYLMKKSFIILTSLLAGGLQAQFQHSYGTPLNEATPAVTPTVSDNGFISAGVTTRSLWGGAEATLIKTDVNGNQLWSRIYGGAAADQFTSVKENPNGNVRYFAVGSTFSYTNTEDGYLVGTNPVGGAVFTKFYGGPKIDKFNHIQRITHPVDGPGYIIVGESNSFNYFGTGFDIYVVRIDLAGNLKASAIIGTKGDDRGNWIEPTTDGYIIAGSTTYNCTALATAPIHTDIYAVKLDHNLNLLWDRVVGNNEVARPDAAYGVKVDNVGNYVFTGETQSYGPAGGNAFLLKFTPAGNPVFFRTYSGPRNEQGRSLIVHKTAAGVFYVVTGQSSSYNPTFTPDAFLFKTDQNGNLVWSKVYGKDRPDYTYEVNFTNSLGNGYILSGNQFSFGAGNSDAYLIKTTVNGVSNSGCERTVYPVVQAHSPCLFKGAQVVKVNFEKIVNPVTAAIQYQVTKCAVDIAEARVEEESATTQAFTLSPNPTKAQFSMQTLAEHKGAAVSIVDLNGRNVKQFNIEEENQLVSVADLKEGMYLVVITQSNGEVLKEKLIIQE